MTELPVIELRQYTLHRGRRDELIELFDREFVETQEAVGMHVLGQFRDLDDADRFVWLRGFAGMAERRQGLQAFYGGPVWAAHRERANATMVCSDDVLLLRPAWPGAGIGGDVSRRAPRDGSGEAGAAGLLEATLWPLAAAPGEALPVLARERLVPRWREAGALAVGCYVSETAANDFPRLPVREGEPVLAVFALFAGAAQQQSFAAQAGWRADPALLQQPLLGPPQVLRLAPTPRSALQAVTRGGGR